MEGSPAQTAGAGAGGAAQAHLYMVCESPRRAAFAGAPEGFSLRGVAPGEVSRWVRFHAGGGDPGEEAYLEKFFERVYAPREPRFYERFLFAVDGAGRPVGSCGTWEAWGCFTALHWLKVEEGLQGRGIGRALLSTCLSGLRPRDWPVLLHTQGASWRAVGLYADFGFALITDPVPGGRPNGLARALPLLRQNLRPECFSRLAYAPAPQAFLECPGLFGEPGF